MAMMFALLGQAFGRMGAASVTTVTAAAPSFPDASSGASEFLIIF